MPPEDAAEREAMSRELAARRVGVSERRQTLAEQRAQREAATPEQRERVSTPERSSSARPSLPSIPKTRDPAQYHRVIAAAWIAGIGVISWQETRMNKRAPDPDRFVGWSVAMGILDLISPIISAELSGVFAIGLVIGLMIFRKPKVHDFPGGKGQGLPNNLGPTTAQPVTPYQPGQTVPNPPAFGSGHWFLDAVHKSVDWLPFYTAAQAKQMNLTNTTDGGPLVPPSSSPNWRYDPSADHWIDVSKLSKTDPLYNPAKAPTLTGH